MKVTTPTVAVRLLHPAEPGIIGPNSFVFKIANLDDKYGDPAKPLPGVEALDTNKIGTITAWLESVFFNTNAIDPDTNNGMAVEGKNYRMRSTSVGDLMYVMIDGRNTEIYMVDNIGFKQLTVEQAKELMETPFRDRSMGYNWLFRFASVATWPKGTTSGDMSIDYHDTPKSAEAVCRLLERHGFGGDKKVFPVKTEVRPPVLTPTFAQDH
jgi:hypothetical protein